MQWPSVDPATIALITASAFKLFIMLADSMPPPAVNCGYWTRWGYDFIQRAASNGEKVGRVEGQRVVHLPIVDATAEQAGSRVPPITTQETTVDSTTVSK